MSGSGTLQRIFMMATGALALVAVACKPADSVPSGDGGGDGAKLPEGCPASQDDLISAFTTDNGLHAADGRQGGWYTYGDPNLNMGATITAVVDTTAGGPCSGTGSWHVTAAGFKDWGAATAVDFKPRTTVDGGMTPKTPYDASRYKGIAFWIKATVPLEGVQVSFPDLYTDGDAPLHAMTDPADPINMCTECKCIYNGSSWQNCSPYLVQFAKKGDGGAAVTFTKYMDIQIDTTWRRIEVAFADARQDPGNQGYKGPGDMLTKDKLTSMALQVNPNYDVMPKVMRDFEIWIDDVTFVK